MINKKYDEWKFEFVISDKNDEPFDQKLPEELFQVILKWCKSQNLMVGGGLRPFVLKDEICRLKITLKSLENASVYPFDDNVPA